MMVWMKLLVKHTSSAAEQMMWVMWMMSTGRHQTMLVMVNGGWRGDGLLLLLLLVVLLTRRMLLKCGRRMLLLVMQQMAGRLLWLRTHHCVCWICDTRIATSVAQANVPVCHGHGVKAICRSAGHWPITAGHFKTASGFGDRMWKIHNGLLAYLFTSLWATIRDHLLHGTYSALFSTRLL